MSFHANASKGLYSLTPEKIANGLRLLATEYPKHFGWFVDSDEDADTGDFFLQLALFGKIIYG